MRLQNNKNLNQTKRIGFIFDGKNGPYLEDDVPNPLSYYGKSKLKSEELLYDHKCRWSILRTIVLFGVADNLSKDNIVLWAKSQLENLNLKIYQIAAKPSFHVIFFPSE